MSQQKNIWKPHKRQEDALIRTEFEVLYGGARGGGKTECGIAWLSEHLDKPNFRALVIRRNSDDLNDWIERAERMLKGFGLEVMYKPAVFKFKSGAIIKTGHLKDDQAYTKYQGHEYHRILIEELTQIPTEKRYIQLISSCRSNDPDIESQIFTTANPGGVGNSWVRARFVDVAEPNTAYVDPKSGLSRVFIPAQIDDNPSLKANDPGYVKMLDSLQYTDEQLYKAWRLGSWDVFAGQVFREFDRNIHVVKNFYPKKSFHHILHMDWGYSEDSAFAAHLTAVIPMKTEDGSKFNRCVTYMEWYGNQKYPDQWAKIIFDDLNRLGVRPKEGYTDPAMHNSGTDGSVSIAEMFEEAWKRLNFDRYFLSLDKGGNNRIAGIATIHNWLSLAPDGLPYWVMTENCINTIRTLPMLVYNENSGNVEDVNSQSDDHCFDSAKYGLGEVRFISVPIGKVMRGTKFVKSYPILDPVKDTIDPDLFAQDRTKSRGRRRGL